MLLFFMKLTTFKKKKCTIWILHWRSSIGIAVENAFYILWIPKDLQKSIAGHERCSMNGYGCVLGSKREASAPATIPGWHKSTPPSPSFPLSLWISLQRDFPPTVFMKQLVAWAAFAFLHPEERKRRRKSLYVVHVWCRSYVTTCPCASV